MRNMIIDKVNDIDEANAGIEIALSGISLAINELVEAIKYSNNKESFTAPINVLVLSMQRLYDEHKQLEVISEEMCPIAKTVSK